MRMPLPASLGTFAATAASLAAQCTAPWLPGAHHQDFDTAEAIGVFDPDGAGPAPEQVVLIGDRAGGPGGVFRFDPATGEPIHLGSAFGEASFVRQLPSGDLLVGGDLQGIGPAMVRGLAVWNGSAWTEWAGGLGGAREAAYATAVMPNGDRVVGGDFTSAGGVPALRLARWDGATWHPFGSGLDGPVRAAVGLPNGDVVVGGDFGSAGGVPAQRLARWDGANWHALGSGADAEVLTLVAEPDGDVIAGGRFGVIGGVATRNVARWDGAAWHALAGGLPNGPTSAEPSWVAALVHLPGTGEVVAGGRFGVLAPEPENLAFWNGTTWVDRGGVTGNVRGLAVASVGDLLVCGNLESSPAGFAAGGCRWDGATWTTLVGGFNGSVNAHVELPNGDLIVAGSFLMAGGHRVDGIARWHGASWHAIGGGLGVGPNCRTLLCLANGDLLAGGRFSVAGEVCEVQRWDGTTWHVMGEPLGSTVEALVELPNGDLVAGGSFRLATGAAGNRVVRWDGTAWVALGLGMSDTVRVLRVLRNGDLVAGGAFLTADGVQVNGIARWSGSTWSPVGPGFVTGTSLVAEVTDLDELPGGALVAVGRFLGSGIHVLNNVGWWDGTRWHPFWPGVPHSVAAVAVRPDGRVVVGGTQASSGQLRTWNGASWSTEATIEGVGATHVGSLRRGDLVVGGSFHRVGGVDSAYFARRTTTCPATAQAIATGCIGPGGPLTLVADRLPWAGGSCRGVAHGFAAGALGVALVGFTVPGTALAQLHPSGIT
jgi:hypothetical protein